MPQGTTLDPSKATADQRNGWLPILQCALLCCVSGLATAQQSFLSAATAPSPAPAPNRALETFVPTPEPAGRVVGTVKDGDDAMVPGAVVTLADAGSARTQSTRVGDDGQFLFAAVRPGAYTISVEAPGYSRWTGAATVASGENATVPEIALSLRAVSTSIEVSASTADVAEAQLRFEEKQRVLGVFPNFYASYLPNAEPLTGKQKFRLAWRFSVDPVAFAMAGFIAGTEQARNTFSGYGGGRTGYLKRFGANYADGFSSTAIGQAVLPVLFHQDPRYFVKGTGSVRTRAFYAIANAVVCKGDNRRWQPNYSNLLGNVASAGISNLYHPATDRHGAGLTIQNSLVTTAFGAVGGLIQEFFLRTMTPNLPDYGDATR